MFSPNVRFSTCVLNIAKCGFSALLDVIFVVNRIRKVRLEVKSASYAFNMGFSSDHVFL